VNANVSDFHSILQSSFQSFYGEALSMLIQALRAALAALVRPRHEDVGATSFWGAVV